MSHALGPIPRFAAFAVAAAGITAVAAGGQEAVLVTFRDPITAALPLVQVALGVAAIVTSWRLAHPRAGARIPAVVLLVLLTIGGLPWAAYLMWGGLFTALSAFAPLFAAAALPFLAGSWGELGRVAALRAIAEAETAALLREAAQDGASPQDGASTQDGTPAERPWLLPSVYAVLAVPAGLFAIAIFAPALWDWAEVRVRGLLAGRSPFASTWVAAATDYPYSGSPLLWYVEYESRWTSVDVAEVTAFGDSIADEVAWHLAAATGTADPAEGERLLWAANRQEELPLWIAEALRQRGVFYNPESLFSRSFDPDLHVHTGAIHLDCDQLVHTFLHVAWRLDLAMSEVPSPMHVYLRYGGPEGQAPIWVETTQFRHIDSDGNRVDVMGQGIGDTFLIDADYHPSGRGGTWASPEVIDAAALYQPWTERDIRDAVVGNVLVGLTQQHINVPYAQEAEAHVAGSREITLVSNLYTWYVDAARSAAQRGDTVSARAAALRARALRAEHGAVIIYTDTEEERILAGLGE